MHGWCTNRASSVPDNHPCASPHTNTVNVRLLADTTVEHTCPLVRPARRHRFASAMLEAAGSAPGWDGHTAAEWAVPTYAGLLQLPPGSTTAARRMQQHSIATF